VSSVLAGFPDFSSEPWFAGTAPQPKEISDTEACRKYFTAGGLDVVLLTVTGKELEAVQKRFKELDHTHLHGLPVFLGKAGLLDVAVVHQGVVGPTKARDVTVEAIAKLRPRVLVSVGIAWGNSEHWSEPGLGDVLVSTRLVHFTGNTAVQPTQLESRDEQPPSGSDIVRFFRDIEALNWSFARFRLCALCLDETCFDLLHSF
jgi:Phosphorylase superfamily